jgi:hypothetical protein
MCFNGEDLDQVVFRKPCECMDYDFSCDYGYVRNKGGQCTNMVEMRGNEDDLQDIKEQ